MSEHTNNPLVVIIGSSSGIGKYLAETFAFKDRKVIGISRRTPCNLIKLPNYTHYNCDITSDVELSLLTKSLINDHCIQSSTFGSVTVVFMSGSNTPKPFLSYTRLEISQLLDLNLMGNIWLTRILLDLFSKCYRVNFIYASSIWSSMSAAFRAPYGASKAAIDALVRHLTAEYIDSSFFFFSLALGFVDTPLTQKTILDPVISSKLTRLSASPFVPLIDIFLTIELLEATTSLKGATIDISNGYQFL